MAHYRHYNDRGYYGEHESLDNNYPGHPVSPARSPDPQSPYHDQDPYYQQQRNYQDYPPQGYQYEDPEPPPPPHHQPQSNHYRQPPQEQDSQQQFTGAHPDSSFHRLRTERHQARGGGQGQGYAPYYGHDNGNGHGHGGHYAAAGAAAGAGAGAGYAAAQPPVHGTDNWGVTPGTDNFSDGVSGGGMAGIAYNVADHNARESGVEAMRDMSPPQQAYYPQSQNMDSHSSLAPLGGAAAPPAMGGTPTRTPLGYGAPDPYADSPYQSYSSTPPAASRRLDNLGVVNPNEIADDGDDGLGYRRPQRSSLLSHSHSDRASGTNAAGGAAAAGAAGMAAASRGGGGSSDGYYVPVKNGSAFDLGNGGGGGGEKSEWAEEPKSGKKKWKWFVIILLIVVVIGAIVGGTLGGVLGGGGGGGGDSDSSGSGQSADEDSKKNGDLDKDSDEIKKLMNNDNLHKVFPGFDYTPLNVQYPYCEGDPPSQNNITRDMAVLSQLTNVVRLYGTDCNQTQMVLHAIDQLDLADTMTLWMGVWIDGNSSTNARQLSQMWDILDEYGEDPFEGLIVANEILFREEMEISELSELLDEVRSNLTDKDMSLHVTTSDLGDDWDSTLASSSDYIMSNIHPFFAGVSASDAASWTWSFWENNNKDYWKTQDERNIIAEIGWPTAGGTNCGDGTATGCPNAAVANVTGLNQLLEDWVCPALRNGTQYFWFSAFDEPWKARFDEDDKEWESKWGLMDVDRNLKDGVEIPDCGGDTV